MLNETPADEVNEWFAKNMGYTEPPYKPGTLVQEIELAENTTFVRVFDGVNSKQANPLFGHPGGGTQFDLMGQYIGDFTNARTLQ